MAVGVAVEPLAVGAAAALPPDDGSTAPAVSRAAADPPLEYEPAIITVAVSSADGGEDAVTGPVLFPDEREADDAPPEHDLPLAARAAGLAPAGVATWVESELPTAPLAVPAAAEVEHTAQAAAATPAAVEERVGASPAATSAVVEAVLLPPLVAPARVPAVDPMPTLPVPVLAVSAASPVPGSRPVDRTPRPASPLPLLAAVALVAAVVGGWWTFRIVPPAVRPSPAAAAVVEPLPLERPPSGWWPVLATFAPAKAEPLVTATVEPLPLERPPSGWWTPSPSPLLPDTAFLPRPPAPQLAGFLGFAPVPLSWWAVDEAWGWLGQRPWRPGPAAWNHPADLRWLPVEFFASDGAWRWLAGG
jgi:hypothetical protein